jgi:putative acetyltransferase
MEIRKYRPGEERALWELFHDTIHRVNSAHYTADQVDAWAPDDLDMNRWERKITSIAPYVAVLEGVIVGYADLQPSGYIDHFFCHHQYQRRGVGKALMAHLKAKAAEAGIPTLTANVSVTARPFFEAQGFRVVQAQEVDVRGVTLRNFKMACGA